ncbi:MAG: hypothetical protein ACRDPG_06910 [Nocardioidaceae bacterium]
MRDQGMARATGSTLLPSAPEPPFGYVIVDGTGSSARAAVGVTVEGPGAAREQ